LVEKGWPFLCGESIPHISEPWKCYLDPDSGKQFVYWSENRQNPYGRSSWSKMSPLGFFYAANRFLIFPNLDYAILTLIQERQSLYWSEVILLVLLYKLNKYDNKCRINCNYNSKPPSQLMPRFWSQHNPHLHLVRLKIKFRRKLKNQKKNLGAIVDQGGHPRVKNRKKL
jgi:hypothetical protein